MPPGENLIRVREKILDMVTGVRQDRTLNADTPPAKNHLNQDTVAELQSLLWEVIAAFVNPTDGRVNYAALRASPAYAEFRECVGRLRTFAPSTLASRVERLAFWINLYNMLILDGVISLDVKRSITERWAGFAFLRQAAYLVGGQRLSCDDIEHGILRANRGHPFLPDRQFRASDARRAWVIEPPDARIHFALNCASRSCPPIRVYSPDKLDEQLDLATRAFLGNDGKISPDKNEIHLSAIFKWFSADFGGRDGVIAFILSHLDDESERARLAQNRKRINLRFKPYDWQLNGKPT